jgi:hypothetical protein
MISALLLVLRVDQFPLGSTPLEEKKLKLYANSG